MTAVLFKINQLGLFSIYLTLDNYYDFIKEDNNTLMQSIKQW